MKSAPRIRQKLRPKTSLEQILSFNMVVAQRSDMYDPELDEDQQVEECDEIDSSDYDDCGDGDATQYTRSGIQDYIFDSYVDLGDQDPGINTPILNIERLYTILINKWPDGIFHCRFEPTKYFRSANRREHNQFFRSVNKLLNLMSEWLETYQQEFIKHPLPENFKYKGTFTQESFLKELYQGEKKDTFELTRFSRITENIWLLWHDKCLPFKALFSFATKK